MAQAMMGGAKARHDGIKSFSEMDLTQGHRSIDPPTMVLCGGDDQIVPIADSALLSANVLRNGALKLYDNPPHGMCTTHPEVVNPDILAFVNA